MNIRRAKIILNEAINDSIYKLKPVRLMQCDDGSCGCVFGLVWDNVWFRYPELKIGTNSHVFILKEEDSNYFETLSASIFQPHRTPDFQERNIIK